MINVDGINYNVEWVADTLKNNVEIMNGSGSGRLQGTGKMYLEYLGTYYNYSGDIVKTTKCSKAEWNAFFRALSNPKNDHIITFPFDDGTIKQEVYISKLSRALKLIKGTNQWGNVITVSFVAVEPLWMADETLKGYTPYDNSEIFS